MLSNNLLVSYRICDNVDRLQPYTSDDFPFLLLISLFCWVVFIFGFKSGICLLIALVPVHCFSITFIIIIK